MGMGTGGGYVGMGTQWGHGDHGITGTRTGRDMWEGHDRTRGQRGGDMGWMWTRWGQWGGGDVGVGGGDMVGTGV